MEYAWGIRMLGAFCIIGGLGMLGLLQSAEKRRRLELLQSLEWQMHTLRQQVVQLHLPLAWALRAMGENMEFLREWGRILYAERGCTAAEAFRRAWEKYPCRELEKKDRELLENFAMRIGQGREEEEERLFVFLLEELKNQQMQAREKIRAVCRLWSYGGFMVGITIVLLEI